MQMSSSVKVFLVFAAVNPRRDRPCHRRQRRTELFVQLGVEEHAMLKKMAKQFETEGEWAWGVAKSHQELDEADWEFWRSRSPDERLAATFQASFDAWRLHDDNRPDGIDLTAFGVRKLGTDVEERPQFPEPCPS